MQNPFGDFCVWTTKKANGFAFVRNRTADRCEFMNKGAVSRGRYERSELRTVRTIPGSRPSENIFIL